jgi:hypothetical protein
VLRELRELRELLRLQGTPNAYRRPLFTPVLRELRELRELLRELRELRGLLGLVLVSPIKHGFIRDLNIVRGPL